MCDSLIRTFDIYISRIYKNKMNALSLLRTLNKTKNEGKGVL